MQPTTHTCFVVVLSAMPLRLTLQLTVLAVVRLLPTLATGSALHFIFSRIVVKIWDVSKALLTNFRVFFEKSEISYLETKCIEYKKRKNKHIFAFFVCEMRIKNALLLTNIILLKRLANNNQLLCYILI